jgi:predicted HTH domain antitoxin
MGLTIPEEVLHASHLTPLELKREIAVMLFAQDRLTLGQASELSEMSQRQFLALLSSRQIPVHYDEAELARDLETVKTLGNE